MLRVWRALHVWWQSCNIVLNTTSTDHVLWHLVTKGCEARDVEKQ